MSEKNREELKDLQKLNEAFLYDIGAEYAKLICEETDALMEKSEGVDVPGSMDRRFYSFLEKLEVKEQKEQRGKLFRQISKRVAMVIIVIAAGISALSIGVDAFRIKFFNILIETREKFGLVSYEEDDKKITAPDDWSGFYPLKLPDDYTLFESEAGNSVSVLRYVDGNGEVLELIQGTMIMTSQIDTEDATIIEVDINGESGIMVQKGKETIIGWNKKELGFILHGTVDKSMLLEIAENITQEK